MTAGDLKSVSLAVFRRKGGPGAFTDAFDALPEFRRFTVTRNLKLAHGEIPIIASVRDGDNWLVITTDRVVWSVSGVQNEIGNASLTNASPSLTDSSTGFITSKAYMRALLINTKDGQSYPVDLEAGPPLIGVWHVLNNLGARNRRAHLQQPQP